MVVSCLASLFMLMLTIVLISVKQLSVFSMYFFLVTWLLSQKDTWVATRYLEPQHRH